MLPDLKSKAVNPCSKRLMELIVMKSDLNALLYAPHFLPGRGQRTGHQRVTVIHGVKPMPHNCGGDHFGESACGKEPGKLSQGWYPVNNLQINCQKCKKALGI